MTEIFRGTFFSQTVVAFGEINVTDTTSENAREVDAKSPNSKVLVECNGYPELSLFNLSGAVEISRRY